MIRFLSGIVLLAGAIAAIGFASTPVFRGVAYALLLAAAVELNRLARAGGLPVPRWLPEGVAVATLAGWTAPAASTTPWLGIVLLLQLIAVAAATLGRWSGGPHALAAAAAGLLPSLYLALPIGTLIRIRESEGPLALLLLMLTVVASDTAQYYTGRIAGRTALAPRISPKKTVEGALGGFVAGALVLAIAGAWWLPSQPAPARALLGAAVVAAGIGGDLFESMLKRSAGVKDSSSLIPGHGGVLDRIDALLFAGPVYYVVLQFGA